MERYVFENRISKMLLLMGSGLAICIKLQDGLLGIMSIDISHLYHRRSTYGALPNVSQMVTRMPKFKRSMKVHV